MSFYGIKNFLKDLIDETSRLKIRKFLNLKCKRSVYIVSRVIAGSSLSSLAIIYGSDKWGVHAYTPHYQRHFSELRKKKLNILEIGIGGYEDPEWGGGSLRMWRTYFYRSHIYGIDIYDKSPHDEKRIKTFKGSQVDISFLTNVINYIGSIDIIIDDGSHVNSHVLETFQFLFPHLNDGGIYIIEDTQTSYWSGLGGSSERLSDTSTTMGYFKSLLDGLNYMEFEDKDYRPNYFDLNIKGIHFYHNLIFVEKGKNLGEGFR